MSMSTMMVYGVGFNVKDVAEDRLIRFIRNHKSSFREACGKMPGLDGGIPDAPDEEDFGCWLDGIREGLSGYSIADVVAAIMEAETGIGFYAPGLTYDNEDYVLFCEKLPWAFNEIEKNLTQDILAGTMKQYADEMGIEVRNDCKLLYIG